jgi:hypothetical protein
VDERVASRGPVVNWEEGDKDAAEQERIKWEQTNSSRKKTHTKATRSDVSGNHDRVVAGPELRKNPVTLVLALVT